jgi:hypothetical protein
MIVIVASRYDASARRLKERWAGANAHLLTSEDLSVSGWRYRVSDPLDSTAIIGGLEVKQSDIEGVFTRLQWVWESELVDIVADDRAYVAAEMSAFLVCWLSGLACPILNRPTANSLNGPGWGREQWTLAASRAGMRINPIRRRASLASTLAGDTEVHDGRKEVSVTVVGDRCFGDVHKTLREQARRLANIAKMDFLAVQFSSVEPHAFVSAIILPDIDNNLVVGAVVSYFEKL